MEDTQNFQRNINICMTKYEDCEDLGDLVTCAKQLIDCTIIDAVKHVSKTCDDEDDCPGCENNNDDDWPTSEKISARAGLRCVKKMMKKWKTEPAMKGWKFYAEFIGLDSNGLSDFYSYQVRWSVPTPAYPEPQVTVSVFFTVEASKINYLDCPVDVTYVFEGNQFSHRPKMQFRPKWIYDVLDMKTMVFKSLKF